MMHSDRERCKMYIRCGKYYMQNSSSVTPGGVFPVAETSSEPLLEFRCAPAIRPYLENDTSAIFIIDMLITNSKIAGAVPISDASKLESGLNVSVSVGGHMLTSGLVPLNASKHELNFSLAGLEPQTAPFDVACTAQATDGETFHAGATLQKLPAPTGNGSVTKMDLRTGAMLVQDATGEWDSVFPLGFYTTFDGYLATNLSILDDLKNRGFTIVHPVPPFDNLTALNEILDHMEEIGLYLMYDMRFTYMNSTSVTEQVNMIKGRKNLLLWYTGDEPDGTSDPLNATSNSRNLINSLDGGGYHPVSLVLNCDNYYFTEYTNGTDIVMQDAYPISINATYSVQWHTPVTQDFGDCGCDNCKGNFGDITLRMDEFAYRLDVLGQSRTKTVWAVPQAFGGSEYWARAPTGNEWLVESVISINHGATGIVPWMDPNPQDIRDAATVLAKALPTIKSFLFDPGASFSPVRQGNIDVGLWTSGQRTLLLASNTSNATVSVSFDIPSGVHAAQAQEIFGSGNAVQLENSGKSVKLSLGALESVGFVLE
ncbi:hypothetical protein EW145_g5685 [Phellinidium pouzarii]|uniref:Uncharacterized protein n=1 Tax=Phellinidium pouzarii TaxID=167371 RepID=A0A4S4KZ48_9AGAM|nr:hypothetical protein EW145_g5685 [Phellinidium pouzarii]